MIARAVWTGLATLFTISLGTALASRAGAKPTAAVWLLSCVFGLALSLLPGLSWRRTHEMGAEWAGAGRVAAAGAVALAVALGALALMAHISGTWGVFGFAGAAAFVLVAVCTIVGRRVNLPPAVVGLVASLLLMAVVLPLTAFSAAGGELRVFPWPASAALLLASAPMLVAIYPELFEGRIQESERQIDRFLSIAMFIASTLGLAAIVWCLPGPWGLRLLGISAATVVALSGVSAVLHPSPAAGRHLAGLLSSISYCASTAGLSLVYFLA